MTDPPTRAGVDDRTVVSYDSPVSPAVPIMAGADTEGAARRSGARAARWTARRMEDPGKKEVRERRGRVRGGARQGRGERSTRGLRRLDRSDRWGRIARMGWRTLRALVLPMVCEGLNAVPLGGLVFR